MTRCLPVLLMGVILLGGHLVSAQVTTATIAGVVQDSSGAVIPGVSIAVKNIDTGVSRTITTDEGGRYVVPDLSLGNYEVEAQLPGFQTEVRSGITLTVGRSAVVNFGLKVGQLSDKVTITGEAPLVELNTATLSSLVDERTIRDLPLNGRSYDKLALLQPGTVIMGLGRQPRLTMAQGSDSALPEAGPMRTVSCWMEPISMITPTRLREVRPEQTLAWRGSGNSRSSPTSPPRNMGVPPVE